MKTAYICIGLFVIGLLAGAVSVEVRQPQMQAKLPIPRPFRPRPPAPPPEPDKPFDDDAEERRFLKWAPRMERIAEDRAAKRLERHVDDLVEGLNNAQLDNDGNLIVNADENNRGSFLVGGLITALFAVIKKLVAIAIEKLLPYLIIGALATVFWKWPVIISLCWTVAVTVVAWPAGWAAGKFSKPKG